YRWYPRPAPPVQPVTFTIDAPEGETLSPTENMLAVSPDGTQVAFTTGRRDATKLWVRTMGSLKAVRVDKANGAWVTAWSPIGGSIAFIGDKPTGALAPLRAIDLAGGPPRPLAPQATGRPIWGGGMLVFRGPDEKLLQVPETGGEPTVAMELDA